MKKILSFILASVLLLSTFTPDLVIAQKNLYEDSGQILKKAGVLQGDSSGNLMLNQNLKRQDMVVLISRLFKEESVAKTYKNKHGFKDIKNPYYNSYVAWSVDKDLIHGMSPSIFGYDGVVTVQQFQTLLLRALQYNEEARDENWNNIPSLAEKYNIMKDLNAKPTQKVDRGLMAAMTVNALKQNIKGKSITLAESLGIDLPMDFNVLENVNVDKNTLKLEGKATGTKSLKLNLKPISSNTKLEKTEYDLNLDQNGSFYIEIPNLKPGQYEYKFISGVESTSVRSFVVNDLPFELLEIKAENLKEIRLTFSTPVDKNISQFYGNYYTNAGTIKSIRLEDDDHTVILTLNETMTNKKDYKLSINKIKSYKGEEINIKDLDFQAFDNKAPEVREVYPLGNKGIRVYMSEPVVLASNFNFKIDGKRFSGKVEMEDNVITLLPYTALSEGSYTLTVLGLDDYAGYRGVEQNINFNIIKDNTVPKIIDTVATTEEVIIKFDKDIDPSSISRTNFYWKAGSVKRYPDSIKVSNDKLILNFSKTTLPTYEISISLNNIMDYSGNKIKFEEIKVRPVLDTTQPEVIGIKVSEDGKSIEIFYSKNVEGKNRNFYTIKDKNNNIVPIRNIDGSGREYKIVLLNPLPIGLNTITIQDVHDTTVLKNRIKPYMEQFYMEDVEKPNIISYSGKNQNIIISFSKEMDGSTVENHQNYIIKIDNQREYLPKESTFIPLSNDGKTWMITLPEKINGKSVEVGSRGNIKEMDVSSIKATNGILMDPKILHFTDENMGEAKVEKAELLASDLIELTFNQPIYYASPKDFKIEDRTIYDVRPNENNVVQILLDNNSNSTTSGKLTVVNKNTIESPLGTGAKSETIEVIDKVAPRILPDISELHISGNTIELPFTEKLDSRLAGFFCEDLVIKSWDYGILDPKDYSTRLDKTGSIIIITIHKNSNNGYDISLVDNPSFIRDLNGNVVEPDNAYYYTR